MYSFCFFASSLSDELSEINVYRYSHCSENINNANNIFLTNSIQEKQNFKMCMAKKEQGSV